ncbi:hypothetical protein ACLOJK_027373, partial [Asimina triloba]
MDYVWHSVCLLREGDAVRNGNSVRMRTPWMSRRLAIGDRVAMDRCWRFVWVAMVDRGWDRPRFGAGRLMLDRDLPGWVLLDRTRIRFGLGFRRPCCWRQVAMLVDLQSPADGDLGKPSPGARYRSVRSWSELMTEVLSSLFGRSLHLAGKNGGQRHLSLRICCCIKW